MGLVWFQGLSSGFSQDHSPQRDGLSYFPDIYCMLKQAEPISKLK